MLTIDNPALRKAAVELDHKLEDLVADITGLPREADSRIAN
jgi:hypothetical protein